MSSKPPARITGRRRTRPVALVVAGLLLTLGACVLWQAQAILRADLASVMARPRILDWAAGASMPASLQTWGAARAAVERSLVITPDDPDMRERLGDVYLVAGKRDWANLVRRQEDFHQAAALYQSAAKLRPDEPQTWAMLAVSRQAMGEPSARVHEAWARARALGPFEGDVQPILMQVVLTDWPNATPDMQSWATHLFDDGDVATRRDIDALAARYGLHFSPDAPAR